MGSKLIDHKPIEQIIIHNLIRFEFDKFVLLNKNNAYSNGAIPHVNWANGIVFIGTTLAEMDTSQAILLQNQKHFSEIDYAMMNEFKEVIELKDDKTFRIVVTDVSTDPVSSELTKWLKEKELKTK